MKGQRSQKGMLAIAALLIIVVFAFLAVIATRLINTNVLSSTQHLNSTQALYIAESGLEYATRDLLHPTLSARTTCGAINGNAAFTNVLFSGAMGRFTVTTEDATFPAPPTTLNGALAAADNIIHLVNASKYAASGRITIDRETIDYAGKSGNDLINVIRGADGTAATAHTGGTFVGQYQCILTSTGGVPNLNANISSIAGQRSVQAAVQLPEVWAVGSATASNITSVLHWNKPIEGIWNNESASLNSDLYAVSALSNVDVIAVGENGLIRRWNGNIWTTMPSNTTQNLWGVACTASNFCLAVGAAKTYDLWNGSTWISNNLPTNVQYNAITCNTKTDCFAVGMQSGNTSVFSRWNGSSWAAINLANGKADMYGISCTASNNCWAVGEARTFARWNGNTWANQTVSVNNAIYYAVDCTNSSNCWAVGSAGNIVRWNGTTWVNIPSPTTSTIRAVKCMNSNDCWAAGGLTGSSPVTIHWDGSNWVIVPNPLSTNSLILYGIDMIGYHIDPASAWQETFP